MNKSAAIVKARLTSFSVPIALSAQPAGSMPPCGPNGLPSRGLADGTAGEESAARFEEDSMRIERAPDWLRKSVHAVESADRLDPAVTAMTRPAEGLSKGPAGDALRGQWLGHALHPLLTDLPLGCWIGSGLLDLLGGRRARRASQRLVGLGLLFVPPTVAAGLVDWTGISDQRVKRVGAVHAIGNGAVAMLYLASWRSRRRGLHLVGVGLGLAGGTLAWATGYLGGHMSFARGVGVGDRGLDDGQQSDGQQSDANSWTTGTSEADLLDMAAAAAML